MKPEPRKELHRLVHEVRPKIRFSVRERAISILEPKRITFWYTPLEERLYDPPQLTTADILDDLARYIIFTVDKKAEQAYNKARLEGTLI